MQNFGCLLIHLVKQKTAYLEVFQELAFHELHQIKKELILREALMVIYIDGLKIHVIIKYKYIKERFYQ